MYVAKFIATSGLVALAFFGGCATPEKRTGSQPPVRDREAAERHNSAGLQSVAKGDFAEAQRSFALAIDADPFFGQAHCNLGLALIELDKPFEAAWSLRHAASLMPRASQPHANLGLLYERVGKWDSAENELREALKISPDDIEVIGQLARVQIRRNQVTPETLTFLASIAAEHDDPAWRDWARQQQIRLETTSSKTGESQ